MARAAMRVVDTSVWIEWLVGSAFGKALAADFPDKANHIVPTIVQLELSKWLTREVGEARADQVIAGTRRCVVVPLDTTIALRAAEFQTKHRLATADAIVNATAQQHGADLLTCDAHFESLTGVDFRSKK